MQWNKRTLFFMVTTIFLAQKSTASLQDLVKASYNEAASCPSEPTENIEKATALFGKLLSGSLTKEDIAQWEALDFKAYKQGSFLIIQEKEDKRRGRGLYVVRPGGKAFFLQAPHHPSDTYTGLITAIMFEENSFLVGAWSTAHRNCVDVAHVQSSYFNAMTKAYAQHAAGASILQLHAFDGASRDMSTSYIMSSTLKTPPEAFLTKAKCLKDATQPEFIGAVFPTDVAILGGTTNENARLFRSISSGIFVHLETNFNFRKTLLNNKQMRDHIVGCIQ